MNLRKIDASYRILKILKILAEKPRSIAQLCSALETENQSINYETMLKYLATLREFGCVLVKKKGKFELKHLPFFINLNDEDIETLANLKKFAIITRQEKQTVEIQKMIDKVLRISNSENTLKYKSLINNADNIDDTVYKKYEKKIQQLENFIEDESKIKILYKGTWKTVIPKDFKYQGKAVFLIAFDENKKTNGYYILDVIEEIINLQQIIEARVDAKTTVFRLTGRVAKSYTSPYENEIITYNNDGSITVFNNYEDKNILHLRLLKYFNDCEILNPKEEREKFKSMLSHIIKIYSTELA